MKKVYSAASAFAHVVRAESVSEGFSGDALKLEGHTINGGKRGTLVRIEKKSTQNRMPREASLKGKLTTSVGNPVLEASVDCKGGCFEFGAIKRKIGNGDLPSAKRSIFKDERVNISNSPSNCESSQCTEAKKNNVNPRIIRPGSVRADDYIPSTTEPYDSIEDFTKRSFNGTNEMNFKHNKTARRALRFVEDDDGEQRRTPVHQVAAVPLLREYSGTFQSERKSHMQPESSRDSLQNASNSDMSIGFIGNVSSRVNERPINVTGNIEMMDSCYSASRLCNVEVNVLKYSADLLAGSNSVNQKKCITASPNGRAANNELETLDSPGNTDKLVNIEALKHQVRGEIPKNNQFGDPCKLFGTSRFSCSPLISQKHKSSLEKSRAITKSNLSGHSFAENRSNVHFSAECYAEKDVSGRQRSDSTRDATSADSTESKLTGSAMSMKHLIAAAQAKRREAHSHQLLDGSGTPGSSLASKCVRGRSPNLMSTMQTLPSRGNPSQKDEKWFQTSVPCELPSSSHQIFPVKQRKHEGYDHRPSTGNLQPSDCSSHSTETTVARDALEGMIETLSRTRDSIGRATRHAIDCAKYGIAKEVVELLIHKLEGEPSLSHRIDLFFLVDSITQCSHTQKGIAGASYVRIVQEALPRLLGAAAPAGASAQENRRQCLKVLRLWLERRILPEYFLRHCMDEIEVRNDGLNFEFSSRIPSCASQCVDDPIREVESLFVDQYGSNTTFLFPGILSAHDLEGDEDFPGSPCNGTADCSPHEVGGVSEVLLGSEGRPMEAHHHALEHVENEIEMEDALTSPDERSIGRGSSYSFAHPQEHRSVVESTCGYQNELLLLPVGSPPLPLDPPPTPPLPPSPPPPTPPPPSSPPPMPPPQSPPIVPSPSPPQLPSGVHGMQFTHQVSYSSQLLQQCGETIQQMPPYSAPPALKILNHPLPSIEMPSDHLYHGNSMCQHHLKQKYSHYPSSSEEQWMSHHGDANQDYSDARNIGGRSPSCSSAPFVGDGCCRLNMARTATSTDFYHLQHYSEPSRASLPGDSFPNFTGIDFWRPA